MGTSVSRVRFDLWCPVGGLVVLVSLVILAVSCTSDEPPQLPQPTVRQVVPDTVRMSFIPETDLAEYTLSDPNCVDGTSGHGSEPFVVDGFEVAAHESSKDVVSFELSATRSSLTLSSPAVSSTHFGREFRRYCATGKCNESDNWQIPSARPLRVCQRYPSVEFNSHEGIALLLHHHLEKAHTKLNELLPEMNPPVVSLEVLPKFKQYHPGPYGKSGVVKVWHNNLAYFPETDMIAVFPESEKLADFLQMQARPHLWEPSFPAFHEYCHAMQKRLLGDDADLLAALTKLHGSSFGLTKQSAGSRSRNRMFAAVLEQTADLCGTYLLNEELGRMRELPGFYMDRSPVEGVFRDQDTPKKLTEEVTDVYLRKPCRSQDCVDRRSNSKVNFTDPHLLGAVLAHGLHQIFSEAVSSAYSKLATSQQTSLKLRWTMNFLETYFRVAANRNWQPESSVHDLLEAVDLSIAGIAADSPLEAIDQEALRSRLAEVRTQYFDL